MRNIPGHEIPELKRQAIERLEHNIQDYTQELAMLKDAVTYTEHELDLARVTLALMKQSKI